MGICLITEDVVELAQFYDQVLQTVSDINPVHTDITTEGASFSIYSRTSAEQDMGLSFQQGPGQFTLVFNVDNVDAEYERLSRLNIPFLNRPTNYGWGARSMQFLDPVGNTISFASRV